MGDISSDGVKSTDAEFGGGGTNSPHETAPEALFVLHAHYDEIVGDFSR